MMSYTVKARQITAHSPVQIDWVNIKTDALKQRGASITTFTRLVESAREAGVERLRQKSTL